MLKVRASELEGRSAFILLGPGWGRGHWELFADIVPSSRGGDPVCWLCPYDARGRDARSFTGQRTAVELELDGAPLTSRPRVDAARIGADINAIRETIAAGDVYQVNYTVRVPFHAGGGADILTALCRRGVPRFAAWVKLADGTELVTASPEMLFHVSDRELRVEPMKGTAAPGQQAWLSASAKDVAELAMITDLLRDDLNHLCEPRSVEVINARRLVELPYVIQAVSDVRGTLAAGITLRDVLDQLHPGGSVTGTPRRAAMTVIEKLEGTPRGAYCGTLGLQEAGNATFALLIRTAEKRTDGTWVYGVGSGITWDSTPEGELDEVEMKLGALW